MPKQVKSQAPKEETPVQEINRMQLMKHVVIAPLVKFEKPPAPPEMQTVFIPVTWDARRRHWKIWTEYETTEIETAENEAVYIKDNVRGHTHGYVLEIRHLGVE